MTPALLDHLWQSTLFALAAGLLTLAFRRSGAAVRYGLWFAASAKFLIPLDAFAAVGRRLGSAVRPPLEAPPAAAFFAKAAQPFSHSPASSADPASAGAPAEHAMAAAAHAAAALDPSLVLAGIWALGSTMVVALWIARWAQVRSAVRSGAPLALAAPMPVLAAPWQREPGLVGLWQPVLLIPEGLTDHLGRPELDALLAHEACHLRRRDNLTAAIHMLVEALFWFHPMVWWIGARLIEERERACDEAVIRAGHSRAAYARSLVECCRLYLQSPLSCVAGASGADLIGRVRQIMTSGPRSPVSRAGRSLLIGAGVLAVATPLAAGWLTSPAGQEAAERMAVPAPVREAAAGLARFTAAAVTTRQSIAPQPGPEAALASAIAPDPAPAPLPLEAGASMPMAAPAPIEIAQLSTVTVVPGAAGQPASPPDVVQIDSAAPPWCQVPRREDMDRVYPLAADQPGIPGRATIICHASSDQLSSCRVESESGPGFGRAAVFLSTLFRVPQVAGYPGAGQVRLRLDFTPPRRAVLAPESDGPSAGAHDLAYWDRGPGFNVGKYIPRRAIDDLRGGQVLLACRVQPTGALADCSVVSETPAGWGFGRGAITGAERDLRLARRAQDGSATAGRIVQVPLVFNAPCIPEGARGPAGHVGAG